MSEQVSEVLDYLNDKKTRATYGAVAQYLGVLPRGVGAMLGEHSHRTSWVVSAAEGVPTDYVDEDIHPELKRVSHVIQTGKALSRGIEGWRQ